MGCLVWGVGCVVGWVEVGGVVGCGVAGWVGVVGGVVDGVWGGV